MCYRSNGKPTEVDVAGVGLCFTVTGTRARAHAPDAAFSYYLLPPLFERTDIHPPIPCMGPRAAVGKYLVLQLLRCHAERDDCDHFRARRVLQSELIMAPSVAFPLLVGWFERLCHAFVIFGHLKVKKKKNRN